MTKRVFSLMMVLALIMTCFAGIASAAPVEKAGSVPIVTFTKAASEFDVTGKANINTVLGTFMLDGNAITKVADNNAIKNAISNSLDLVDAIESWEMSNGILSAKLKNPQGFVMSAVSAPVTFKVTTPVNPDYDWTQVGVPETTASDVTIGNVVTKNPVNKVTLAGRSVSSGTVISGTNAYITGKVADAFVITPTATYTGSEVSGDTTPLAPVSFAYETSDAKVATVTSAGEVTATGVGVATITATASNKTGSAKATFTVSVDKKAPTNPLTVTKVYPVADGPFPQNTTVQLITNAAADTTVTETAVNWTSSNPAIATVDANGLVTVLAASGSTTITATSAADSSVSGTFSITATAATADVSAPVMVIDNDPIGATKDVTRTNQKLSIGTSTRYAQVYYAMFDDATAYAAADDANKVKAAASLYSAPIELNENKVYYVKAVSLLGNTLSNVTGSTINVSIAPTKVVINKSAVTVQGKGQTVELSATIEPANANTKDIEWTYTDSSSILDAAKSDDSPKTASSIKLVSDGKAGSITITATAGGTSIDATCVVTVEEVKTVSIASDPASISLPLDQTAKIKAVFTPDNVSNQAVSYLSNDTAVVVVADGVVTPAIGATAGQSTYITITSTEGSKKAICNVTLVAASSKVMDPTFSVADGKKITSGTDVVISTLTPEATIRYTTDGSDPITSSTANTGTPSASTATVNVTGTGLVTVKAYAFKSNNEPSAVVSATYDLRTSVTGVAFKDGSNNTITTKIYTGTLKDATTVKAVVAPAGANNLGLTVTSSDETVVKVKAVQNTTTTSQYDLTIETLKAGTATLTATSDDGAKTATLAVTVKELKPEKDWLNITGTASVKAGETAQFKAEWKVGADPRYPTDPTVTWSISQGTEFASIDATKGLLTGVAEGFVVVKAEANAKDSSGNTISKTYNVTIGKANDTTANVILTVKDDDGNVVTPLTGITKRVTVTASSATVGAVIHYSTTGTPTASDPVFPAEGLKLTEGTYLRLIAIASGKKDSAVTSQLFTFSIATTKIVLDKKTIILTKGDTSTLTASFNPEYATDKAITWETNEGGIATVNNGKVTAVAVGKAMITAKLTSDNSIYATCDVIVEPVAVTSVEWTPAALTVGIGDTGVKATAIVKPETADANSIVITSSDKTNEYLTWSQNNGVLTINSVIKAGSVTFTATAGGKSANIVVTIGSDPAVAPIEATKVPTFVPSTNKFYVAKQMIAKDINAVEGSNIEVMLGKFVPGAGETWEQIIYYNTVGFAFEDSNTNLLTGWTTTIDRATGEVKLIIPNVGRSDVEFKYTWTLTQRSGRGTGALTGTSRTVDKNALIITKKPSFILFTDNKVGTVEMTESETKKIAVGTVSNYASFVNSGVTVNVSATKGTASIDTTGAVSLELSGLEAGKYDVVVTVKAEGCSDVAAEKIVVTVTDLEIKFTDSTNTAVDMFDTETNTTSIGIVTNLAELAAAGYTGSATVAVYDVNVDPAVPVLDSKFKAELDITTGSVNIVAEKPAAGKYEVYAMLNATDGKAPLNEVKTHTITYTITTRENVEIVAAKSAKNPKGILNISKADAAKVEFSLKGGYKVTKWSATPAKVVIDANGVATIPAKLKKTITITAEFVNDAGVTQTASVKCKLIATTDNMAIQTKVGKKSFKKLSGNAIEVGLVGAKVQVKLRGKHGPVNSIKFTSSDESIFAVTQNGAVVTITPKNLGTAKLTVTDFRGNKAEIDVTVTALTKVVEEEATEKVEKFVEIG